MRKQAIAELKQERDALKAEVKKLHDEVSKLQKGSPSRKTTELSYKSSVAAELLYKSSVAAEIKYCEM